MALLTSQPQHFFTQPLSVQEATPCATYHHTVGPTLTGAPFFHPGYAFGTSCRSMSSQRQPWRPSREGCPVTIRCNRGMFLPVFKSLLTSFNRASDAPCTYSQCDNAPERALHLTGEEEDISRGCEKSNCKSKSSDRNIYT